MKKPILKTLILNLSVSTFSCVQIILFALIPVLSESLMISYEKIIGSLALGSALFIFGSPYWSARSEKIGKLKVLRIGIIALAVSLILLIVPLMVSLDSDSSLILLTLSIIIYGHFDSALIPVAQLLRLESQEANSKAIYSHSFWLNFGRTLGLILLLSVEKHFLILLLSIISALFSTLVLTRFIEESVLESQKVRIKTKLDHLFLLPLSVSILFTTYVGILHSRLGAKLKNVFNLSGDEATVLMSKVLILGSVLMAITQVLAGKFVRNYVAFTFFGGLLILGIGALRLSDLNVVQDLWFSLSLISMGIGLIQPSHLSLVHQIYKEKDFGHKLGLLSSGNTIGYALGGFIASLFLKNALIGVSLIIIALLYILASGQYYKVHYANR
jgi:MFS family permease